MDFLWDVYPIVAGVAYNHQEEFLIVTAFSIIALSSVLSWKGRKEWKRMIRTAKRGLRGNTMTREEREAYDKKIQGDAIWDALDALVENGKQTQHSVNKTLRRLANVLSMPDFISAKQLDMSQLTKEEFELIQGILRSTAELRKLVFQKQKVNIPGPKPGEVDNVTVFDKKAMGRAKQLALEAIPKKQFGGNLLKAAVV